MGIPSALWVMCFSACSLRNFSMKTVWARMISPYSPVMSDDLRVEYSNSSGISSPSMLLRWERERDFERERERRRSAKAAREERRLLVESVVSVLVKGMAAGAAERGWAVWSRPRSLDSSWVNWMEGAVVFRIDWVMAWVVVGVGLVVVVVCV